MAENGNFLLFVCHANVCRSPMAERLTRSAIALRPALRASPLVAASAGTHARAGTPMHAPAAEVLGRLGADSTGFRSRPLDAEVVAGSAVVLTATREQRAAVVTTLPAAVRRTFTLRELGRLAAALDPGEIAGERPDERLAALLAQVPRARAAAPPPADPADDDLADPVNGTLDDVWACAREILRALETLWRVIEPR